MTRMIKAPMGWSGSQLLRVAALAMTLTLTACGGGNSGSAASGTTLLTQIQTLIATGTSADLLSATELLLSNADSLSATDFQALMDALAVI